MTPKQHPPLEAAALQLQVLPLPSEQVCLLLCLEVLDVLLLLGQPLLLLLLGSALVLVQLLEYQKGISSIVSLADFSHTKCLGLLLKVFQKLCFQAP